MKRKPLTVHLTEDTEIKIHLEAGEWTEDEILEALAGMVREWILEEVEMVREEAAN